MNSIFARVVCVWSLVLSAPALGAGSVWEKAEYRYGSIGCSSEAGGYDQQSIPYFEVGSTAAYDIHTSVNNPESGTVAAACSFSYSTSGNVVIINGQASSSMNCLFYAEAHAEVWFQIKIKPSVEARYRIVRGSVSCQGHSVYSGASIEFAREGGGYPPPSNWAFRCGEPEPANQSGELAAQTTYSLSVGASATRYHENGSADTSFQIELEVIEKGPCPGDLNSDGFVDDNDFPIFVVGYNVLDCADPAMPSGCPADLNTDGFVDDADFVVFVMAYNELVCP